MTDAPRPPLQLSLYIAGDGVSARRARDCLTRLMSRLAASAKLEIIDVLENPEKAEAAGIIATPTLSQDDAVPPRRIVGDLSDTTKVLAFFGVDTERQE